MQKGLFGILVSVSLTFSANFSLAAQNVDICVKGIRSACGQIIIAVFDSKENFENDKPIIREKYEKTGLVNGVMKIKLSLEPGTYGIAILDDENRDDKMTTNLIGYPKEGYGFSNYYHTGLRRPDYEKFRFEVSENKTTKVESTIKYQ